MKSQNFQKFKNIIIKGNGLNVVIESQRKVKSSEHTKAQNRSKLRIA